MKHKPSMKKDWISPPGDTIKDALEERAWSIKDFSEKMTMPEELIENLLQGKLLITEKIADKLSEVIGSSRDFWLRLEEAYRKDLGFSHSPESWDPPHLLRDDHECDCGHILDEQGDCIATIPWHDTRTPEKSHETIGSPRKEIAMANARRIIACVNALQGFKTKDLEKIATFLPDAQKRDEALESLLYLRRRDKKSLLISLEEQLSLYERLEKESPGTYQSRIDSLRSDIDEIDEIFNEL